MLAAALVGIAALAVVNGFGAWVTQNRRRWIAWLFLTASWLLVIALVTLIYRVEAGLVPLGAGLLLTAVSSWLHARLVTARVIIPNHIARLLVVLLIFWLAWSAVQQVGG